MKSYFHKRSNMKTRLKKCGKKTCIPIGFKSGRLTWEADQGKRIRDKNILGHRLVDGWTRWVACAYIGQRKDKP